MDPMHKNTYPVTLTSHASTAHNPVNPMVILHPPHTHTQILDYTIYILYYTHTILYTFCIHTILYTYYTRYYYDNHYDNDNNNDNSNHYY